MNVYGIYKQLRNASWRCLIDYQVSQLPVDPLAIARSAGIKVIKDSEIGELSGGEAGTCLQDDEGNWIIIYDDECSIPRRRLAVAHELGHIFLGHELRARSYNPPTGSRKSRAEIEADAFAVRLLSPACVLSELKLHTPDEIAQVCDITKVVAKTRAARMAELYKRQKFRTDPLEQQVYDQFKVYIDQIKFHNPSPATDLK